MALVATDGFDMYNGTGANTGFQAKWYPGAAGSLTMVAGRFAGQAIRFNQAGIGVQNHMFRNLTAARTSGSHGFALFLPSYPVASAAVLAPEGGIHFGVWSAGAVQCGIRITSTGAIEVNRNANVLGTSAAGVLQLGWQYVEFEYTISASVGVFNVYVEGAPVSGVTLSGVNTKNASASTADAFIMGNGTNSASNPTGFSVDDWYEGDTVTKINPMRIDVPAANSDSAVQFTPNGGANNYGRINEAQVDGDTTYVEDGTVGHSDLYGYAALPTTPNTIYGVQAVDFGRKTDAGPRSFYQQVKSGATLSQGSPVALGTSYARFERMLTTNPATGLAWTPTEVNAMLRGPAVAA